MDPTELFERFLVEQTEAHAEGLGTVLPDGLVMPFEDSPLRPLDARGAWSESLMVAGLFAGVKTPTKWSVAPGWPELLLSLEPVADVPLALGNFPQRVRSLTLLLRREPSQSFGPGDRPELVAWAQSQREPLARLLAAGVLRLTGDFATAADLLAQRVPASLEALRANEAAALTWQRGDRREALAAWQAQAESPAVLFNRGMASLFLAEIDAARSALEAACAALPETGGWHHLASVYRVMVELDG